MDRAQTRAGEHGDGGLRHHRHVDEDAVAVSDAVALQHAREGRDLVEQLGIGEFLDAAEHGAVIDERGALAVPRFHMAVERVPAAVGLCADEPAGKPVLDFEGFRRGPEPVDFLRRLRPEAFRVLLPGVVGILVASHAAAPRHFRCWEGFSTGRAAQGVGGADDI